MKYAVTTYFETLDELEDFVDRQKPRIPVSGFDGPLKPQTRVKKDKPPKEEPKPAAPEAKDESLTLEVRKLLHRVISERSEETAKQCLVDLGVEKLSALAADKYSDLKAKLEAALDA